MPRLSGGAGIGARLAAARTQRGLTLEQASARLKIARHHLLAMEQEAWDSLPGPAWVPGFVRAYGRLLGLDGERLAAELRGPDPLTATAPRARSRRRGLPMALTLLLAGLSGVAAGACLVLLLAVAGVMPRMACALGLPGCGPGRPPAAVPVATRPSPTPQEMPGPSPSPAATPAASATPTPAPQPSPSPTPRPSPSPTPRPSPSPTPRPSPSPTPRPSPSPTPRPSPSPSLSPSPSPTPRPSPSPAETAALPSPIPLPSPVVLPLLSPNPPTPSPTVPRVSLDQLEAAPPQPAAAPPPAGPITGLALVAERQSFVQILRADGTTLLRRSLEPGDRLAVPSEPGLTLNTGNAGGLVAEFGGRRSPPLGEIGTPRRDVPLTPEALGLKDPS